MRQVPILLAIPLLLGVGCGSSDSELADTPSASAGITATTTPPTTLSIADLPSPTASAPDSPAAPTGTIVMIKLVVGTDIAAAEKFYGTVFGAKPTMTVGDSARILTLPKGGPGLLLATVTVENRERKGAFIIQVPDLGATKALALANGATLQQEFSGAPGGRSARSIDLLDPWGNQVEILQNS